MTWKNKYFPDILRMYTDEIEHRELAENETQKAIREKAG